MSLGAWERETKCGGGEGSVRANELYILVYFCALVGRWKWFQMCMAEKFYHTNNWLKVGGLSLCQ